MIIKNNKILKVSAIATILSIGLLSAGYTLANKNITLVVKMCIRDRYLLVEK